jgi:hypothetical protein
MRLFVRKNTYIAGAFVILFFSIQARVTGDDERILKAFSDPVEIWGPGVESVIEGALRECFKTYNIDGKVMTLRMPFAQNNERSELADAVLPITGGGKSDPSLLWTEIESILASTDFNSYTSMLGDGREKVIIFDLPSRTWKISVDLFDIARMKAGAYRGLPHRPYVLHAGNGVGNPDIYNYLYCIGRLGMDCSGFVWHVLSYTAARGGVDLGKELRKTLRVPRGAEASLYVGARFFDSKSSALEAVKDSIKNLRPADIILFRGEDGTAVHSAVIQSINFKTGRIRYLQSTDEAPQKERGTHESFIYFDPAQAEKSLKDTTVVWTQKRFSPFPGEKASAFSDDGVRYRAYGALGGGRVVRLRAMAKPLERIRLAASRAR